MCESGILRPSVEHNRYYSMEVIDELRNKIDQIDGEIIAAIRERTAVSHTIGRIRRDNGGERIDPSREEVIYAKYREIGEEGEAIANILLQLGRGKIE